MKTALFLFLLLFSFTSCNKQNIPLKDYFEFIDKTWLENTSTQGKGGPGIDFIAQVKVKEINSNEIHLVSTGERETITMKLNISADKVELKETIIDSQQLDSKTTYDPPYVLMSQEMLTAGSGNKTVEFTTNTELKHITDGVQKSSDPMKLSIKWAFHEEYQGYKNVFVVNTENIVRNYTEESIYMKGRGLISYTYKTPNFKLTKENGLKLKD